MERIIVTTPEELSALLDERIRIGFKHYAPPLTQPAPDADTPAYVSKKEAARLLGVCASTIDNIRREGNLKASIVGKSIRFERKQILALAKQHSNHKQPK